MELFQMAENLYTNENNDNFFKNFLKNYPNAIWIKDSNFSLIHANKNYYEMFETTKQRTPNDEEYQLLKDGKTKFFTIKSDKTKQILSVCAIPKMKNNQVQNIVYISQNITEQELLKERFFVSKYQLDALLDNIPEIIYMKDLNGNYITGTKYAKEFHNSGYDYFHKIELNINNINKTKILEDKSVIEQDKTIFYEKEFLDKSGLPHWYKIYKSPIHDYNCKVIGIVIIVNNIDDEKDLQAQRETFIASLGHDLKNPTLAQIRAIELLLKEQFGKVSPEQKELLEMVLDSCKYMNAMLGSLLATYRDERGTAKLNFDKYSLIDISKDCISEMIYIAKDKNVSIQIENTSTNSLIYADKVQIKRVIMNLLSNAIKYAYKNTIIKANIYNEKEYTCFSLENRSPYIPQDKQDSIFAKYVSFAEAHKELGIGLGLYASKKIINAHGGNIFVKSFEDERNIFGFKLLNKKHNHCCNTISF